MQCRTHLCWAPILCLQVELLKQRVIQLLFQIVPIVLCAAIMRWQRVWNKLRHMAAVYALP